MGDLKLNFFFNFGGHAMMRRTLFVKRVTTLHRKDKENAQPAYAEGFGVAGAHLSRRSESEGGTSLRARFLPVGLPGRRVVLYEPEANAQCRSQRAEVKASSPIEHLGSSIQHRFNYLGPGKATSFWKRGLSRSGSNMRIEPEQRRSKRQQN